MEDPAFLRTLAVAMLAAAATTILLTRLRQPVILGYIAAGFLIGPRGPVAPAFPGIVDPEAIATLAELGVLFLLFGLGLTFHIPRLWRVGGIALTAGSMEVAIMAAAGFGLGRVLGWSAMESLFLGAVVAISSTTLIVKTLTDGGRTEAHGGDGSSAEGSAPTWTETIFGILILEDLAAVVVLALLSSLAISGTVSVVAAGAVLGRVAIFVMAALVLGVLVVPRLMDYVSRFRVEEVLVVTALGVAFGFALLAAGLGFSVALGAFIAGALVAESAAASRVERRMAPLRDAFTAVFFVAVGMLLDPAVVREHVWTILAVALLVIGGKVAAVTFAAFVAGSPPGNALRVGLGLAMIGEFSFVIASLALEAGATAPLFAIAVSVSAITALVTPLLVHRADAIVAWLGSALPGPLATYLTLYSRWMSRAAQSPGAERRGWRSAVRAVVYFSVLVALVVSASFVDDALVAIVGNRLLVAGDVPILVWAGFAVVAIPVVLGIARSLRATIDAVAGIPGGGPDDPQAATARRVVRSSIWLFGAVMAAALFLSVGGPFLPPLPLLAGVLLVVGVATTLLWGSLKRLHAQVETAVDAVFAARPAATREGSAPERRLVRALVQEKLAWGVHVKTIEVPSNARAAHQRIRDLRLPQTTGATIVSLERAGEPMLNPGPDTVLFPGDRVVLLGERGQVELAHAALRAATPKRAAPASGEAVELEEASLPPGSPLVAKTIAGARIRERTGVTVVGLRREGKPVLNPPPVMRLKAGDVLLILGSAAQRQAARVLIAEAPAEPTEGS